MYISYPLPPSCNPLYLMRFFPYIRAYTYCFTVRAFGSPDRLLQRMEQLEAKSFLLGGPLDKLAGSQGYSTHPMAFLQMNTRITTGHKTSATCKQRVDRVEWGEHLPLLLPTCTAAEYRASARTTASSSPSACLEPEKNEVLGHLEF